MAVAWFRPSCINLVATKRVGNFARAAKYVYDCVPAPATYSDLKKIIVDKLCSLGGSFVKEQEIDALLDDAPELAVDVVRRLSAGKLIIWQSYDGM